ncbi:hypothetical protein B0H13DRAFT_2320339 [Mycena leptocephala]|nr:hypothetical protein B0H13DRAFT_2320339 [Mycena leptocephala]
MFSKLSVLASLVIVTLAVATVLPPTSPNTLLCCDSVTPCCGPIIPSDPGLPPDLPDPTFNVAFAAHLSLSSVAPGASRLPALHDLLTDHSCNSDRIAVECEKWDNVLAIGINCVDGTL